MTKRTPKEIVEAFMQATEATNEALDIIRPMATEDLTEIPKDDLQWAIAALIKLCESKQSNLNLLAVTYLELNDTHQALKKTIEG